MPELQFRVVSHDVGGGFGSKNRPYPEEYLATAASKIIERPVKWIEDRTESLQATTHGRGQIFDVEVAANRDGTLLGLKFTQLLDIGAYHGIFSAFQVVACLLGGGCYEWKAINARSIGIFTNRMSTDRIVGAGRPEATHLVERIVDLVAPRDRHGPGRGPAQELHQELPAHQQLRPRVRLRRLREVDGSRDGQHRLPGAAQAPGGIAGERADTRGSGSAPTSRSAGSVRARRRRPRPVSH